MSSTPNSESDGTTPTSHRKIWILVAIIGFIAAFFFQWKNALDQGAIAETDSGTVIRVKVEGEHFKFFTDENIPISDAILCNTENGNVIGALEPVCGSGKTFVPRLTVPREIAAQPHFVGVVIPSLISDGAPVFLILENPFR